MLISNFNQTYEICKQVKSEFVTTSYANPGILLGSTGDMTYLRVMNIGQPLPHNGCFDWIFMNGVNKNVDLTADTPSEFLGFNVSPKSFFVDVRKELNQKLNTILYQTATEYQMILTDADFKSFPEFEQLNSMKATEGGVCVRFSPKICFYVFKSLIPFTKADSVKISIYVGQYDFIVRFDTIRKKGYSLSTWARYLYVN